MTPIHFTALGIPKPQPRPRAFAMKFGNKYQARVYDAGTAEGWKSQIAVAALPWLPATPITEPVFVTLKFTMPRPKSHFTKKGLRPNAPAFHIGRGDCDNLGKAVLDCLTQIHLWGDDGQVARLHVEKVYGDHPGVEVLIEGLLGERGQG